jgi:hypothetical protein
MSCVLNRSVVGPRTVSVQFVGSDNPWRAFASRSASSGVSAWSPMPFTASESRAHIIRRQHGRSRLAYLVQCGVPLSTLRISAAFASAGAMTNSSIRAEHGSASSYCTGGSTQG